MIVARSAPRSRHVDIRGLDYHVLEWGDASAPPLVLLHGWMDVAASFQFMVDALAGRWHVIAPDWQGFGQTAWRANGYWFQDYLADLDVLLRELLPAGNVNLVGHSLGGNVAMIYAGAHPANVRSVIALDGFGIPDGDPAEAPAKLGGWLDALAQPPSLAPYASLDAVADRLQSNNPRLTRDKAEWLAAAWARTMDDGTVRLRADPRHKLPFPTVYRMDEVEAAWRAIRAPVLWVAGDESKITRWLARGGDPQAEVERRMRNVTDATLAMVEGAGHMLHHDQPQAVAAAIESFLGALDSRI